MLAYCRIVPEFFQDYFLKTFLVLISPKPDSLDHGEQGFSEISQVVLHLWWHDGVNLPCYQFMFFQLIELYVQYPPGYIGDLALQLARAFVTLINEPEYAQLPLPVKHFANQVEPAIEIR